MVGYTTYVVPVIESDRDGDLLEDGLHGLLVVNVQYGADS